MRRLPFGPESAGLRIRRKSASRPRIETLEDRRLLTTFFVTSTLDAGPATLRQAIIDANASPGSNIIDFNINGSGVHKISLTTTALPTIINSVLIDGTSQPANGGTTVTTPLIQVDGSTLPAGTNDGLTVNLPVGTSPSTIRGLAIGGFTGSGIVINGAGGNSVQGSLIGTTPDGTAAAANGNGILINGSPNNSIGGTQIAFRNLISGNTGNGIRVQGAGATGTQVQGNLIGTDIGGTKAIPNDIGVEVSGAANSTIGGPIGQARNVISGNTTFGIQITATGASNNAVQGNYVGLNASGTGAIANGVGVEIDGAATGNSIGGSAVANRNVISGNTTSNIQIIASTNNVIVGNTVGLNSDGTAAINLTQATKAGIEIEDGATGNTIGGISAVANNIVSGSAGPNIQVRGKTSGTVTVAAANNLFQGNFVGTDLPGVKAVTTTTGGGGIVLRDGTTGNTVGGISSGLARNLVAGNIGAGVSIIGAGTTGNLLQGNVIGVQLDGVTALANTGAGVFVDGATNNTIGGSSASAGNTIANNGGAGVFVNAGTGIDIQKNSIFGNTALGIDLAPAGVNPNQPSNPATGANNLQNYPVLTSVTTANGVSTVSGTLNSAPTTTYTLDFYSNTAADATNHGQGKTFAGSTSVTTDATGKATFSAATNAPVALNAILSATATDGGGNTSEFAANLTNLAPTADLVLTLTAIPEPVAAGGQIAYTITVKNNGPSNATNVVATNTLPSGVSFIGATSSAGSIGQTGSTVTASLGVLASGATATITITVVAPTVGSLTDTASVALTENDPTLANNTASVVSTVVQGVDLVVTTSVSPAITSVGVPSTITYTVTNASTTNTANTVNLLAPLGTTATVVSSSSSQGSTSTTGGMLTAAIGTLAPGASATVFLVLNPTVTGTILTTATASSTTPDVNLASNSATATITVGTTPITPVGTDGPRVLGLDRAGFHAQVTRLTLTFNSTLNATTANNLANYKLVSVVHGKKKGTTKDVSIPLSSAFYDATAKTVTIKTRKPLPLHKQIQFTAIGVAPNGIQGSNGALLDGADTGSPGSNFVTSFKGVGPGRISVTAFDAAIASLGHKRHR